MLIDTHAHLNFKSFDKNLGEVIKRAEKAKVSKIIIPGAKIDSSKKAITISQKYKMCYAAVGIHPNHANKFTTLILNSIKARELEDMLFQLGKQPKVVAIGEIGLDYYQHKNHPQISERDKEIQKELFFLQLDLADRLNLPIIVHCRKAYDDLLELLTNSLKKSKNQTRGVFHCFEGTKKHLLSVLKLGFYVGFSGNITYPENRHLQALVRLTPLDRLVVETDSPFLSPLPFRGKINEPAYLHFLASEAAQIYQLPQASISKIVCKNAKKLFMI